MIKLLTLGLSQLSWELLEHIDHVFPNPRTPPAQCIAYASARKIFLDYETLHRTPLDKKPPGDHHY